MNASGIGNYQHTHPAELLPALTITIAPSRSSLLYPRSIRFADPWRILPTSPDPGNKNNINWEYARQFLRRFLAKRLDGLDPSTIEDVTEEAIVRLYRASLTLVIRNLEAMMVRIGRWCAMDYFRQKRVREILFDPGDPTIQNYPDPHSDPADQFGDPKSRIEFIVIEYFEQNNVACKQLAAAYFAKRSWSAVSRELGKTAQAIRKQWERCVQLLRKEFAEGKGLL